MNDPGADLPAAEDDAAAGAKGALLRQRQLVAALEHLPQPRHARLPAWGRQEGRGGGSQS